MENESFEDMQVAELLNKDFVSIKVDKEERPDIDSIYMRVCMAYTGSGGWPTSVFLTEEQKPFFAGTYYPKQNFIKLLKIVKTKWDSDKSQLIDSSNEIIGFIDKNETVSNKNTSVDEAFTLFKRSFDNEYGGFGKAPKFPTPHNLMFLMNYYDCKNEKIALDMAEKTLLQMYKGGIFDHIGYGFSRYSTDKYWLAPHFEKMLYDNALLSMAYLHGYELTKNELYCQIAKKTFTYIEREMTSPEGGFYSAQDADSEGVEGKYYVFKPDEIINLLGKEDGNNFNAYFDITEKGNFEGESIPNVIKQKELNDNMDKHLSKIYEYRKNRTKLHKDDKILTSWNALMIAALADGFRIIGDEKYIEMAVKATDFIEENLTEDNTLYVSAKDGKRYIKGFLDDYAFYIYALISLYQATFDEKYLQRAETLTNKVISDYLDETNGGFYINGSENEKLIMKPKETYDGAIPSGNSVMYYNLSRLYKLTKKEELYQQMQKQQEFMQGSIQYAAGNSFYLMATTPTKDIFCVVKSKDDIKNIRIKSNWVVRVLEHPTKEYPLLNDKTTYYICEGNSCRPPTNEL